MMGGLRSADMMESLKSNLIQSNGLVRQHLPDYPQEHLHCLVTCQKEVSPARDDASSPR